METARVITNGNTQTIQIPSAFRLDTDEVFINKVGNTLLITSVSALAETFDKGAALLTDDFLADGMPEGKPSFREEL